ncbi:hypothetical protein MNBD_UNCLBAC01-1318 [hydrothermal vent metagenome]|uniref:Transmembrane protein n=1 Tax=hydrothermal vent metagenome TaxID=652676 RepID=A0A3B1DL80_9ZZZZ
MKKNAIEDILNYWFEGVDDTVIIRKKDRPFCKWFFSNKRMDTEIKERFEINLKQATEGEYKDWEESMRGRLALILLFDQFSRNIYRHRSHMFAYDDLAVELSLRSIHENRDQELQFIERVFLYMPFMHAEDLEKQKISVKCFIRLVEDVKKLNVQNISYYEYHLSYAQKQQAIIVQHGRFLHRDAVRYKTPS